jgi:hypothetical protein
MAALAFANKTIKGETVKSEKGRCLILVTPSARGARAAELEKEGVVTLDTDRNNEAALRKAVGPRVFTHVLNLAAQAGVLYATVDPTRTSTAHRRQVVRT